MGRGESLDRQVCEVNAAGKVRRGDGDGAGFGPSLQIGGAQDREGSRVGKEFKGEIAVGQLLGGLKDAQERDVNAAVFMFVEVQELKVGDWISRFRMRQQPVDYSI